MLLADDHRAAQAGVRPLGARVAACRLDASRRVKGGMLFLPPFQWSFTWTTLRDRADADFDRWTRASVKAYLTQAKRRAC